MAMVLGQPSSTDARVPRVPRFTQELPRPRDRSCDWVPLGKRFWALTPAERKALSQMFASDMVRPTLTSLRGRAKDDPIELLDAAYWMKGCSSLGRLRYAAILRIGHGKNSSFCLADVKEGVTATAPREPRVEMPRDNALRVVTGARALSPNLGQRMMPAASRKISRCSGAHAARLKDRDQWTEPPGSDQSGALSSRSGRTRTWSPNESQPTAGDGHPIWRKIIRLLLKPRHGCGRAWSSCLVCTRLHIWNTADDLHCQRPLEEDAGRNAGES